MGADNAYDYLFPLTGEVLREAAADKKQRKDEYAATLQAQIERK
jgi:hypothetical protein